MTVADVVEAMSSHRPYRPGLGVEAALTEITNKRGIQFDPQVVDACLACILRAALQLQGLITPTGILFSGGAILWVICLC